MLNRFVPISPQRDSARSRNKLSTQDQGDPARIALIGSCAVQKRLTMDGSTAPLREPPPSADTQTGFFACTFYLVFKEPAFFKRPAFFKAGSFTTRRRVGRR